MASGLKTRKKQRLWVVSTALTALIGAVLLVLYALGGDGFNLFLQPTAVIEKQIAEGQRFRLGGLVKAASFKRLEDGLTNEFLVTDCVTDIRVHFKGLLPDLFREGQGVITEGKLNASGLFIADTVLAKHDENYAPPGTTPKNIGLCEHPENVGKSDENNGYKSGYKKATPETGLSETGLSETGLSETGLSETGL